MAAWRYEISLLVLKKYFTSERSKRVEFAALTREIFFHCREVEISYLQVAL